MKLIVEIEKRTRIVAEKPEIFRESEFPETRMCPMGHFSLFYKATLDEIIIVAFWDNRDDPEKLEKLIRG